MGIINKIKDLFGSAEVTTAVASTNSADKACAWAKKIAADNSWHYVKYSLGKKAHECPICHKHPKGKYHGWNCIGYAFATWRHGSGLKIKCSCQTMTDAHWNKILKASDKEALKIAQERIGIKDIKVIRNGGEVIPTDKLQKGDIIAFFDGSTYKHTALYIGGGKMSDCSGGQNPNIKYGIPIRNTCKAAIRYTGDKATTTKPAKTKKHYTGTYPTLTIKKTNAEVIKDTITWAKWIAGDNRFHYGYTNKKVTPWKPNAHHNGCYFCGTNTTKGGRSKKGIVDYQFTYCCNPFVGAAWAHGGCVKEALTLCQKGSSWDFHKGRGYDVCKQFTKLGKPAKSKLKAGDVLCSDGHVALYVGNGKVVQATSGDDNVRNSKGWNKSISVGTWNGWKRAYRYNGTVNFEAPIKYGEVGERVRHLQLFLAWYGYKIIADGIYGDKTLAAVKKFQKAKGIKPTGTVGKKTIAKMKECKK